MREHRWNRRRLNHSREICMSNTNAQVQRYGKRIWDDRISYKGRTDLTGNRYLNICRSSIFPCSCSSLKDSSTIAINECGPHISGPGKIEMPPTKAFVEKPTMPTVHDPKGIILTWKSNSGRWELFDKTSFSQDRYTPQRSGSDNVYAWASRAIRLSPHEGNQRTFFSFPCSEGFEIHSVWMTGFHSKNDLNSES
jgi:hypothetical protein